MLDEELIKRILLEKPRVKDYIRRNIKFVDVDKIYTIIGPRRAGKTYLLFQIRDELRAKGVSENQILYINFEDERLSDLEKDDLQKIIDVFYTLTPENKKRTVFFMFDEIQNVPYWSKFVRRLYDKENCKIYITGSSAKLLSRELATELRGRTWTYFVYPFSFKEYLKAKGLKLKRNSIYGEDRYSIIKFFEEYLNFGGFPEVCNLDKTKKCILLQNYYDVVMFRDIIERHHLSNIDIVKDVFKLLVNNFARPFSVNKIYNILKSLNRTVSKDFLYSLLSYLEDTFYFFFVPVYSDSAKVRMINPKKVYIIDNGLINCLLSKASYDEGWFYENLVAVELIRRGYTLNYYRDKKGVECDFIAQNRITKERLAVQVSISPNNQREIDGLLMAMEKIGISEGLLISKDTDKQIKIKGKKIRFIPLWKWLLIK